MKCVIRAIDSRSNGPRWVAPHFKIGVRRFAERDEARIFDNPGDAEFEISILSEMTGGLMLFEIEPI
jgi:hypothetical protein